MNYATGFYHPLTRFKRLAAFSLIVMLAFLTLGCQALPPGSHPERTLAYRRDACSEGLLAARAWECLRGARPSTASAEAR